MNCAHGSGASMRRVLAWLRWWLRGPEEIPEPEPEPLRWWISSPNELEEPVIQLRRGGSPNVAAATSRQAAQPAAKRPVGLNGPACRKV